MSNAGRSQHRSTAQSAGKPASPNDSRAFQPLTTGIVIGLLVGAGLALFLAPRRGDEARHALRRRMRRAGFRGRAAWEDLRDELTRARLRLKRYERRAKAAKAAAEFVI